MPENDKKIEKNGKNEEGRVNNKDVKTKVFVESGDTLPNVIRRKIANEILDENYQQGERLDEKGLAEKFNVSRTPIREALRQLESARLVEIKPNRGAVVISPDKEYLQNLFETAAELEGLSARFSAARMTMIERMHLSDLQKMGEKAAEEHDSEKFANLNRKFLSALVNGMHNPIMGDVVNRSLIQTAPFRKKQFEIEGRLITSIKEHEKVVQAINNHDMDAAHSMMSTHVSEVFFAVLTHMNLIR